MILFSNLEIYNRKKRFVVFFIDLIGRLLFLFAPRNRVKESIFKDVKKILLIRMDYIGDVVMTTAVIKPLRKAFPNAKISFLCSPWSKEILEGNPFIDEIIIHEAPWHSKKKKVDWLKEWRFSKELKQKNFDLAIEFRGDVRDIFFYSYLPHIPIRVGYGRGGGGYLLTDEVVTNIDLHWIRRNLALLEYLKIPVEGEKPKVFCSDKDRKATRETIKSYDLSGGKYLIGVQSMARVQTREWLEERFAEVADRCVRELGARVYFTGGPKDVEKVARIQGTMKEKSVNLAGKLSLKEEAALFEKTDLFLSNETGLMHLASAMNVPLVALFGPQLPSRFGPFSDEHTVIWHNCGCWPSDQTKCREPSCMELISVDEVYEAMRRMLEEG